MGRSLMDQISEPVSGMVAKCLLASCLIIFGRVAYVLCAHSMNPADYYSNHRRKRGRESH